MGPKRPFARCSATVSAIALLVCVPAIPSTESHAAPKVPPGSEDDATSDLSDSDILGITDTANQTIIERAAVVVDKARTFPMRTFAGAAVRERTSSKVQGRNVANDLGLAMTISPVSTQINREGASIVRELNSAETPALDRYYVSAELLQHQKLLDLFDDALVPQADAPKLKTYLREMRRIVAQERDRLRALQNNPDAK
jgi:predicted outer membrane protein